MKAIQSLYNRFSLVSFKKYVLSAPVILTVLLVLFSVTLVRADDPHRVGLVIVHEDGEVIEQCIEFSGDKISGYEVLEQSGLDLNIDLSNAMGAAVCRIDNEGCTYPEEECFCKCSGGGGCKFWSYWYLKEDKWKFSGMGAGGAQVGDGEVQGWKWGSGTADGAAPPPLISFDEICEPPATDTPTPTDTPTGTPTPTDTPEPEPTAIIDYFSADKTTIDAGESVTLSWDLSKAKEVYLRYDGVQEGVVAPGSKDVTPLKTTRYTLVALNDDGDEAAAELTVTVNPVTATPAPNNQPANRLSNQPTGLPTNTPLPPTTTPAPGEPIISFSAASPTLPVGACTSLIWTVENAAAVYLEGVEVALTGSQEACPAQTQVFNLKVNYPDGERTARLTLEVIDPIALPTDSPTEQAIADFSLETAPQPTQPIVKATQASLNPQPTVVSRPARRNVSPQTSVDEGGVWSTWARFGIWGGLLGGWCVISLVVLVAWGGFWWLNRRQAKR